MNYQGGYYQPSGTYLPPTQPQQQYPQQQQPQQQTTEVQLLPGEQSYIENILRFNKGRECIVHMTFPGISGGPAEKRVFKGIITNAGRDHLVLKDIVNNKAYLLLMVYLDYVEFDEYINVVYPTPQQIAEYYSGR